ncbi:hypothetical protein MRB53_004315 [Persea americana]|uniref:Uncharacterized protein n=1 Tax=Persea americana TaxID=3435 RepID=A0ACC2M9V5_PERAE|nr:hypothetical protein MRB53_004315 [Persea americana]
MPMLLSLLLSPLLVAIKLLLKALPTIQTWIKTLKTTNTNESGICPITIIQFKSTKVVCKILQEIAQTSKTKLLVAAAIQRVAAAMGTEPRQYRGPIIAELIVRQAVTTKLFQTFVTIPATLRLFFHDCFIEGCDASIMIASPNGDAEKDAPDNLSLAGDGFDTIIKAKQAVEAQCPGVVSCADILAMAARDVVFLAGGPLYNVELGRRDGLISKAGRVPGNLPEPTFDLNLLNWIFRKNNLTQIDMVALSGAPPSASPTATASPAVSTHSVPPPQFDNVYYQNLEAGKGLFTSDQVLFTDPASKPTVANYAANPASFAAAFVEAMRKLGRAGVKTGNQGEIRRDCAAFN